MRTRIRPCCRSRFSRACASSAFSVSSTVLTRFAWTVETSLTLSAISRVTSWNRVKRSNSSGSNSFLASLASSSRDCICDSAWISISRSWARRRATLSVSSCMADLSARISPSMRLRAIATSPASLTSRSTTSARTRRSAFGWSSRSPGVTAAGAGSAAAAAAAASGFAAGACGAAVGLRGWVAAGFSSGARGFCNCSNSTPMRSHDVSSSSNRVAGRILTAIAFSTRVSMRWVSSPIAIAPALAELGIVRMIAPVAQCGAHRRDQLVRLVEENLQQFRIEVVVEPPQAPLGQSLLDLELLRRKLGKLQLERGGLRGRRLRPDVLEPRNQLRDRIGHAQFDHFRNHRLDRVDRFSDQRLFLFGELAGCEFLQRLLERVPEIGEGRDLHGSRSAGERVHRAHEGVGDHAVPAQGFVLFPDRGGVRTRFAAENGE